MSNCRWNEEKALLLNDGDDRLHNVIVSLKLSLDVLNADAQRLARLVALLPDGLALAHARAVLGSETDKAVMALVKAGLADERTERLLMLAPLREAVKQCLPPIGADMKKAAEQFRELLQKAGRIGTSGWPTVQEEVIADANNLNDMLKAVTNYCDSKLIAPAVVGLAEFHSFSGRANVSSLVLAIESLNRPNQTHHRAICIANLGEIALRRSDHEGARVKYEEALPLFRKLGDAQGEANCIQGLGDIALHRSDSEGAAAKYEEALPLFRKVGDVQGEANCIQGLGDIALRCSDHEGARAKFVEALPLFRKVGAVLGESNCIRNLGDIALRRSDHEGARAKFEEALLLFRKVGDVQGEANCIHGLGDIALSRSDHDGARAKYEVSLTLFRKVGEVLGEANCIQCLGDIALRRSDHEGARAKYEEALPLFRKLASVEGEANCIQGLGNIAERGGSKSEAKQLWEKALALYGRIPEPYSMGLTHRRLARVTKGKESEAHVAEARRLWRSIDREDLVKEFLPE